MFEPKKVCTPCCYTNEVSYPVGSNNLFILNHGRKKNVATFVLSVLETPTDSCGNPVNIITSIELNDHSTYQFTLKANEVRSISLCDFYALRFNIVGNNGIARLKIDTTYHYISETIMTMLCEGFTLTTLESSISLNYTELPTEPLWQSLDTKNNVTIKIERLNCDIEMKVHTQTDGVLTQHTCSSQDSMILHVEDVTQISLSDWSSWSDAPNLTLHLSINQIIES